MGLIARIKDRLFDRRNVIEIESLEEGGQPLSLESLKNTTLYQHSLNLTYYLRIVGGTDVDIVNGTIAKATSFPTINYAGKTISIINNYPDSLAGKKLSDVIGGHSSDYNKDVLFISATLGTSSYKVISYSEKLYDNKPYMEFICSTKSMTKVFVVECLVDITGVGTITNDNIQSDTVTKL